MEGWQRGPRTAQSAGRRLTKRARTPGYERSPRPTNAARGTTTRCSVTTNAASSSPPITPLGECLDTLGRRRDIADGRGKHEIDVVVTRLTGTGGDQVDSDVGEQRCHHRLQQLRRTAEPRLTTYVRISNTTPASMPATDGTGPTDRCVRGRLGEEYVRGARPHRGRSTTAESGHCVKHRRQSPRRGWRALAPVVATTVALATLAPAPAGSAAAPPPDTASEFFAAAGITVSAIDAPVVGDGVSFTDWQADNLYRQARAGQGWTGAQWRAHVPLPDEVIPIDYIVGGWLVGEQTPAATAARQLADSSVLADPAQIPAILPTSCSRRR